MLPAHGSNPEHLIKQLDMAVPEKLIDFSVNTNPFGPPAELQSVWQSLYKEIADYPDPYAKALKAGISAQEQIDGKQLLIGNGASELIHLIARMFQGRHVLIVDPTFSEYRTTCEAYGCHIASFQLNEDDGWQLNANQLSEALNGKDAVFICHPNNPTGVTYSQETLLKVIEEASNLGVYVVIDEAFYDFCIEEISMSKYVTDYRHLIILRSLTKMYALAGIRLGYIIADEAVINHLKRFQPHWSVNTLAQKLGELCIKQTAFVHQTKNNIGLERCRLFPVLKDLGYRLSPSKVNYYLLREETKKSARPLLRFLIERGIAARHTDNFIGLNGKFLRCAIRTQSDNDQLLKALKEWKSIC
ncbi:threonine-phosphate decarboxylase CobD [Scopulibacillus cellulosilyticus]|uniref:threonine-phosphate decarboxylase n=1 Tax=Scopulibacillus cellulosilyticus TaxID=2665665 RepID=A0ABW2PUF9_9BACL